MADSRIKPNETLGKSREGFYCAGKCDSKGWWHDVGPVRFSEAAAMADLIAARGKRRSAVEWIDWEKQAESKEAR